MTEVQEGGVDHDLRRSTMHSRQPELQKSKEGSTLKIKVLQTKATEIEIFITL